MPRLPDDIPESTLRLVLTPGLGPFTLRRLRERFGNDDAIVRASPSDLEDIDGIGAKTAAELKRGIESAPIDDERCNMAERGAGLLLLGDDDYPPLLQSIPDPPVALWIRGDLADSDQLAVAIVGSRRCTAYGREQAGRFAALLGQSGLTIISGGAIGVDAEAHRGALRVNARTIAVLGCGLARCYPHENEELFERIADGGGALLSEYPMTVEPRGQNFPRRNRIISGLSLGVLVIEASHRSGALITARVAADEHGREVMALPGRVDSPASAGCLKLIREGGAALVVDHSDVIQQLDGTGNLLRGVEAAGGGEDSGAHSLFDSNLTDGQRSIVECLGDNAGSVAVDQLVAHIQAPMSQIMADLTLLEIRGIVRRDPSGIRLKQRG